jgi:Methyltransferase domain
MGRPRRFVILLGAAGAAVAVLRHGRRARGREVPGGILIGDAAVYDTMSRLVLGSLVGRIADDVAAVAPDRARVLEVGCGPGHLSIRLARQHGLEVTGLDLDSAMIRRGRANAHRPGAATSPGRRFSSVTWPRWPSRTNRQSKVETRFYGRIVTGVPSGKLMARELMISFVIWTQPLNTSRPRSPRSAVPWRAIWPSPVPNCSSTSE